jgi:hypothetical protein
MFTACSSFYRIKRESGRLSTESVLLVVIHGESRNNNAIQYLKIISIVYSRLIRIDVR